VGARTKQDHPPRAPSRRDPIDAWLDVLVRLLRVPRGEQRQIRDELEDHLRSRVHDLMIAGVEEHDAVRQAVTELGETAELAHRFTAARRGQKRRLAMQITALTTAGAALALSITAIVAGSTGGPSSPTATAPVRSESSSDAAILAQSNADAPRSQEAAGAAAPHDPMLRRYDVSDLIGSQRPIRETTEGHLIKETIQELVASDSWRSYGGDEAFIKTTGNIMFVRADESTQAGVQWVLEALREQLRRAERQREDRIAELEARLDHHAGDLVSLRTREQILQMEISFLTRRYHQMQARGRPDGEQPQAEAERARQEILGELDQKSQEYQSITLKIEDIEPRWEHVRDELIGLLDADHRAATPRGSEQEARSSRLREWRDNQRERRRRLEADRRARQAEAEEDGAR